MIVAIFCAGMALLGPADARGDSVTTPDIPAALPAGYIVLPFVNESGVSGLEWMRAGLPAALAEKLEGHPGLRALYGPLILPDGAAASVVDGAAAAAAAAPTGAALVWSGSYSRPNWKLELVLRLWRIEAGQATLVGEKVEHGEFGDCFDLLDDAALELLAKAGLPAKGTAVDQIRRAPTHDFYAFTLYGRGLYELRGLGGPADLARAEKDLTKALFIDPKFAEAHLRLAVLYAREGQAAKASGQATYALDLRPDYYAPLAVLVEAAYDAKDRDTLIPLARRALTLRPWDLDVRYRLGATLWEGGDADGALVELERLVRHKPDHLAARRVLVLIRASKGDAGGLASELEQIVRLDPSDEAARLDLGAAYHALGRDSDAIAAYQAIVDRNPKHMLALKFLGDLYRARGDLPMAIQSYERALAVDRDDPRPYFLLGAAYLDAGREGDALKVYLAAQRFDRYLPETYSNLGAIYYRRGDNEQALWYLGKAVAKRPANPRIHYNYGLALARAHKRDAALREIQAAVALDATDAGFQFALGAAYLRVGKVAEAEAAFHECLRLDPAQADAEHDLALIEELRRRARDGEIQIE